MNKLCFLHEYKGSLTSINVSWHVKEIKEVEIHNHLFKIFFGWVCGHCGSEGSVMRSGVWEGLPKLKIIFKNAGKSFNKMNNRF